MKKPMVLIRFIVVVFLLTISQQALAAEVGTWHMDGDWVDSSGNGNNGTPYNGATFSTTARHGTHSANFNGSNYVDFGNSASLNITNAITIEA